MSGSVPGREDELVETYRAYLDCLNRRSWEELHRYVLDDVVHNGRPLGLSGYRQMLEQDVTAIPDLRFDLDLLVAQAPFVAARLRFDCRPVARFLGLDVSGRRVRFSENVIYRTEGLRISEVWSVVDRAAIEQQLAEPDSEAGPSED